MFRLQFNLQNSEHETKISVAGQALIIDGQHIDFCELAEGEQCETTLPLMGTARRINGVVEVSVQLQYSTFTAEPIQSPNPDDYVVFVSDGPVPDVIKRKQTDLAVLETENAQA